jgi:uncharacterized membrane protein
MNSLLEHIYWYCTDFCINAANLIGISYVEFNFLLFLIIFPAVILILLCINIYRYLLKSIWK